MTIVPEGAQLSDDGEYFWDGSQWQAVPRSSGAASGTEGGAEGATTETASRVHIVEIAPPEISFDAEPGPPVPAPGGNAVG